MRYYEPMMGLPTRRRLQPHQQVREELYLRTPWAVGVCLGPAYLRAVSLCCFDILLPSGQAHPFCATCANLVEVNPGLTGKFGLGEEQALFELVLAPVRDVLAATLEASELADEVHMLRTAYGLSVEPKTEVGKEYARALQALLAHLPFAFEDPA